MTDKNQWLIDLYNDPDLWAKDLHDLPAMISFSYEQLREFARQGQVYGIMLQCKDLFESLMKVPVLMALITVNSESDETSYREVMKKLLENTMSMGSWNEEAANIIKHASGLSVPAVLIDILKKTKRLYSAPVSKECSDVVNWRNNSIGHGALRFEDDPSYQQEVKTLLNLLKEYFDGHKRYSIQGLYKNVYFKLDDLKLCGKIMPVWNDESSLKLIVEENEYDASKYLYARELKGFLFESYFSRRKVLKYTSYTDGKSQTEKNIWFDELYAKYVKKDDIAFEIDSGFITRENEIVLEYLHTAFDYIEPERLLEKLEDTLEEAGKGIISIFMERGTGKSAFANRMSGLYHASGLIPEAMCRCVHVQNVAMRGISDFINGVNFSFRHSFDPGKDLYGSDDELKSLRLDTDTPASDMADFLNYYHERYAREYTVFVIDGIDEMNEETAKILEFVPASDQLKEGVFVILLSRFKDENTVLGASKKYIDKARELSNQIIEVRRKEECNLDVLYEYAEQQKKAGNIKADTDLPALIEKADYRFLYLKALCAVSHDVTFDNLNETRFIESYLEYVLSFYGPVQAEKIKEIAVCIALFPGMTIRRYCELISFTPITCELAGFFNDLLPLMSVYRMDEEDVIQFADAAYSEYVISKYGSLLKEEVRKLNRSIEIKNANLFAGCHVPKEYTEISLTSQEIADLIFFAETALSLYRRSVHNPEDTLFFEVTDVIGLMTALFFGAHRINARARYLSDDLADCIAAGLMRYLKGDPDQSLRLWTKRICEDLNTADALMSQAAEVRVKMQANHQLNDIYGKLLYSNPITGSFADWFWLLAQFDSIETIRFIAADQNRAVCFADLMINEKRVFMGNFANTLLTYEIGDAAKEKLYNYLLRNYLPGDQRYIGTQSLQEVRQLSATMEQNGYRVDDSVLGKERMMILNHIDRDDLDDIIFDQMSSKLVDLLYQPALNFSGDEGIHARLMEIFEFIESTEEYEPGRLNKKHLYQAIYDRIVHELNNNSLPDFFDAAKVLPVKFIEILETISDGDDERLNEMLGDWSALARHYASEGYPLFAVLEANLRIRQIEAAQQEGNHRKGLSLLEDLVYHADTRAYIAFTRDTYEKQNPAEALMQEKLIFCTPNALALLKILHGNRQKPQFDQLTEKIEQSVPVIMERYYASNENAFKAEGEIFTFMKYRSEYGIENEFDTYVQSILTKHEDAMKQELAEITADSSFQPLYSQIEILLEYEWRRGRWEEGIAKCDEIIELLSSKCDDTKPIVKNELGRLTDWLRKVRNFLCFMSECPYEKGISEQEWLSYSNGMLTLYIDGVYQKAYEFMPEKHRESREYYLPEPLQIKGYQKYLFELYDDLIM